MCLYNFLQLFVQRIVALILLWSCTIEMSIIIIIIILLSNTNPNPNVFFHRFHILFVSEIIE